MFSIQHMSPRTVTMKLHRYTIYKFVRDFKSTLISHLLQFPPVTLFDTDHNDQSSSCYDIPFPFFLTHYISLTNHTTTIRLLRLLIKQLALPTKIITLLN